MLLESYFMCTGWFSQKLKVWSKNRFWGQKQGSFQLSGNVWPFFDTFAEPSRTLRIPTAVIRTFLQSNSMT